ncbi:Uncharacterised protein [Klebsiella pneumoniae]|nr:hypothetical protein PAERUG_P5_London_26_VIM_2_01_09_05051 [Pseudomonas aeruginosa]SVJ78576.1 Uncharacterised protein [Klebsiella pneumoniae]VFT35677.1 Uncharacterised protein [Pseudomonas aeruginosa]
MMPKLMTKSRVFWPMLNALVATTWLACIATEESFSCRLERLARSKRSSHWCTDGGKAATACCR